MDKRIALGSGGIPSAVTDTIYAIHADGSDLSALATQGLNPVYSPDGARIAFVSVRDHGGESCGSHDCNWNGKLYAMSGNGSGQVALTHGQQNDERPAWTADGRAIVFLSDRANLPTSVLPNADLYAVAAGGGLPAASDRRQRRPIAVRPVCERRNASRPARCPLPGSAVLRAERCHARVRHGRLRSVRSLAVPGLLPRAPGRRADVDRC